MKIHIMPCATGPGAWTHQADLLHDLFQSSQPRLHTLTDDPVKADVIFLTNIEQQGGPRLEQHSYPQRFAEKCFVLSEGDAPPYQLAGIYANTPRRLFARGRFRTGSYALHHSDFHNPFVDTHDSSGPSAAPDLLASFLGRNGHPVRRQLFALPPSPGIRIEDTSAYNAFTHDNNGRLARQRHYYEISRRSKFILCPRGAGPNSIRLFEALRLGIAPVIISDEWIPCEGPNWSEFALFVPEKNVADLPDILARAEPTYWLRGELAQEAYREWFSPESYFNFLVAAAGSIRDARVVPERWFVALWPLQRFFRKAHGRTRRLAGALKPALPDLTP